MKTVVLGQLFFSSLHPAPLAPASLWLIQYPDLLLITEKNVEEEESEATSLDK